MRTPLYILCCFVVLSTLPLVAQQQLTVSLRVGAEIDSAEREYFGLLPYSLGFKSCIFTEKGADSVRWNIRFVGKDTSYTIARKTFVQIGEYLEQYEQLTYETFIATMQELYLYALPIHRNDRGKNLQIQLRDSTNITGELLCITDSCLVLKTDTAAFRWNDIARRTRIIHYSEIRLYQSSFYPTGTMDAAGLGLAGYATSLFRLRNYHDNRNAIVNVLSAIGMTLTGLGADLTNDNIKVVNYRQDLYLHYLYTFKGDELFNTIPAIEIDAMLRQYRAPKNIVLGTMLYPHDPAHRWHFKVSLPVLSLTTFVESYDYTETPPNNDLIVPIPSSLENIYAFDLLYSLSPTVRVGVALSAFRNMNKEIQQQRDVIRLWFIQPQVVLDYILSTSKTEFSSYWELSTGIRAGMRFISRDLDSFRLYNDYEKVVIPVYAPPLDASALTVDIHLTGDFYFTSNFSIFMQAYVSISPSPDIPDETVSGSRFGRSFGWTARNIRFNTVIPTLALGTQWHL